jgi:hypothetical protein
LGDSAAHFSKEARIIVPLSETLRPFRYSRSATLPSWFADENTMDSGQIEFDKLPSIDYASDAFKRGFVVKIGVAWQRKWVPWISHAQALPLAGPAARRGAAPDACDSAAAQ